MFANDLAGVSWSLANDYDVHILGLQTNQDQKLELELCGEKRRVIQHRNWPRSNDRFDFGRKALPWLLDNLEPDVLLTVNDIQMVQHIPEVMCPNTIKVPIIDLPAKKFVSSEAVKNKVEGEIAKFKEKFPRETKWIQYAPQDGDPPMPQWDTIYRMADKVVAMSKYGQRIFKNYFNLDVPYIWHGVDTNVFKNEEKPEPLKDKFIVGNLNRNQPRKQPVRSMIAFAKFAKDKPDALLHYQMDWNDEFGWPIQYFAQQYGILNRMIQPKPVGIPRNEIAKTYNMWDLNLMTTAGEGFGLNFIEGFACGVPALGTEYTTSKELVMEGKPGPRGSLVKVKDLHWQKMDVAAVRRALIDIDHLAELMNKYYYNRNLIEEEGKAAEKWAKKNVSWEIIQEHWKKVVADTLSE